MRRCCARWSAASLMRGMLAAITSSAVPQVTADRLDLAASRIDHHILQRRRRVPHHRAGPRQVPRPGAHQRTPQTSSRRKILHALAMEAPPRCIQRADERRLEPDPDRAHDYDAAGIAATAAGSAALAAPGGNGLPDALPAGEPVTSYRAAQQAKPASEIPARRLAGPGIGVRQHDNPAGGPVRSSERRISTPSASPRFAAGTPAGWRMPGPAGMVTHRRIPL
jgi:hypothetical protein